MRTIYRIAFFWILFSIVLGGKNWVFPYGVDGAFLSVREQRTSQIPRQNHFALHALKL
jgi:hypothetical protein